MKKFWLVLVVSLGLGESRPSGESSAVVIKLENENNGGGNYRYRYETSNGISMEEMGEILNKNSDQETLSVRGFYSYPGTDGREYFVHYVADDLGFRPKVDSRESSSRNSPGKDESGSTTTTTTTEKGEFVDFIGSAVLATLAGK